MTRRAAAIAVTIGLAGLAAPALAAPVMDDPLLRGGAAEGVPPANAPPNAVVISPTNLSHEAQAAGRELASISQDVQNGDTINSAARLKNLIAAPGFAQLPPEVQRAGFMILASLDLRTGQREESQTVALKATTLKGAGANEWGTVMSAALARRDYREAAVALTSMANYPNGLARVSDNTILPLWALLRTVPGHADVRFQLGQALIAANWRPHGAFDDLSSFIIDQSAMLLDRGDVAEARGVIGFVDDPVTAVVGARVDKRFAPLFATNPAAFDLPSLHTRRIGHIEDAVAQAPNLLSGYSEKADNLIIAGRFKDALQVMDDALARAQPADDSPSPYADLQQALAGALSTRAKALATLGRYDEAVAELAKAANRPENGHLNITQRFTYARLLIQLGRTKEALQALDDITPADTTASGLALIEHLRVCAAAVDHDQIGVKAGIEALRARMPSSSASLEDALICAGDLDGATQLYLDRLKDPEQRVYALAWAQDYLHPPAPTGPHPNYDDLKRRLLARPDVKAAIDAVGHVDSVPLYSLTF